MGRIVSYIRFDQKSIYDFVTKYPECRYTELQAAIIVSDIDRDNNGNISQHAYERNFYLLKEEILSIAKDMGIPREDFIFCRDDWFMHKLYIVVRRSRNGSAFVL